MRTELQESLEVGIAETTETEITPDDFSLMLVHLFPKGDAYDGTRKSYCGLYPSQNVHGKYHRINGWPKSTYLIRNRLPSCCPICGAPFCPECAAVHNWRHNERRRKGGK